MTQNRHELLEDALCLMDEELLARVAKARSQQEGRGVRRLVTVFGRRMPALLASAVAVGILIVCVAAVPGVIRMVRLLTGITPSPTPPPTPPVGGSVAETEEGQSREDQTVDGGQTDHIHAWSPWVPWADGIHERHCHSMECGERMWEKHTWVAKRVDRDGMLFQCEQCNTDQKEAIDSPNLLRNLKAEGAISVKLTSEYDSAAYNRVITVPATVEAIIDLFRTAEYVPDVRTTEIVYGLPHSMTVFYADGSAVEITALPPCFSAKGEGGCVRRQYLSSADEAALVALVSADDAVTIPDSSGTLTVDGVRIDCGEHRPLFREAVSGGTYRTVVLLPLTVTLRALGMTVSEIGEGRFEVVYAGKTYELSVDAQSLTTRGESMNLLAPPSDGVYCFMEAQGNELMVDTRILFDTTLPSLTGNHDAWSVQADVERGTVQITRTLLEDVTVIPVTALKDYFFDDFNWNGRPVETGADGALEPSPPDGSGLSPDEVPQSDRSALVGKYYQIHMSAELSGMSNTGAYAGMNYLHYLDPGLQRERLIIQLIAPFPSSIDLVLVFETDFGTTESFREAVADGRTFTARLVNCANVFFYEDYVGPVSGHFSDGNITESLGAPYHSTVVLSGGYAPTDDRSWNGSEAPQDLRLTFDLIDREQEALYRYVRLLGRYGISVNP